jgi:hypothetical protein
LPIGSQSSIPSPGRGTARVRPSVLSPSTGRRYGLARVCRLWGLPRSTVYFRRHRATTPMDQRPEPKSRSPLGACSDEDLVVHIRRMLGGSPSHGEG